MTAAKLDRRIAGLLALGMLVYSLFFVRGHFGGTDEVEVFEQTKSLYERGDLAVPKGVNTFPGKDGRLYAIFAAGQSVLAVPFYALGKAAEATLPVEWAQRLAGVDSRSDTIQWGGTVPIFFAGFYSPVMAALLVGLFYLLERRLGASPRAATLAAVLLGTTTYVSTLSSFFLQHTTEALLLLGGFYLFHVFRTTGNMAALSAGSLVASSVLLVRIPGTMAMPALVAYVGWVAKRRGVLARAIVAAGIPALLVLAAHVLVNHWRFGTWLRSPYIDQLEAFTGPLYIGIYGFLLSPGGSLFVYSPLLLLLFWTLPPFFRRHRAEGLAIAGLAVVYVLACSKNEDWTGLYSAPGPRFLLSTVPFLMLPLGPWLDEVRQRGQKITLAALAAAGVAVQLLSLSAHWGNIIAVMQWEKYVPPLSFVWIPNRCPLAGSVHALAQGLVDSFPLKLLFGAPGIAAAPGAALALLVLWAALLTGIAWCIVRTLRVSPANTPV